MPAPLAPSGRPIADKREALLTAARRLVARNGLHNTPTSAVAREAGVAAGTLFLYFPSKEALINALYLDLLGQQYRIASADGEPPDDGTVDPRESLRRAWYPLARWLLDHPEAARVLQQCRTAGILTDETRAAERRLRAEGLALFGRAVARGAIRDLPGPAFAALYLGPIHALVDAAAADGARAVTDDVLHATFDGVCRGVLPADGGAPAV